MATLDNGVCGVCAYLANKNDKNEEYTHVKTLSL